MRYDHDVKHKGSKSPLADGCHVDQVSTPFYSAQVTVFRFRIECHSDVSCQSSSYVDGAEKQQNHQDRCSEQLSESSRLSSCVIICIMYGTIHHLSDESCDTDTAACVL